MKKKLIILAFRIIPASLAFQIALFIIKNKTARNLVKKLFGRKITHFIPFIGR
ncbi:hypothetical protein [Rothia sp. ZJ1223]|uniref:hypothetical protein n=1 Tax=Rothia sp. ZJ1223 TaxID=2811098 RepID=UPI00195E936B|nr:hypothetical protein [Rothia sp. ZJ1223]MBM7052177.1 hypothetical protein [Rothia sp. ZJ1223]